MSEPGVPLPSGPEPGHPQWNPASAPPPYSQNPYGPPPPEWDMTGATSRPIEKPLSAAAVTSLVFGIIGGVCLSFVFGLVGLSATSDGSRRGRGFAWAGLALSVAWTAVGIVIAVVLVNGNAGRDHNGQIDEAGSSSVFDLQQGDCVVDPPTEQSVTDVDVVPCTQAHRAQVFALVTLDDGDYDPSRIEAETQDKCKAETSVITTDDTYDLVYYYPEQVSWESRNDRLSTCLLESDTPLTASVVG